MDLARQLIARGKYKTLSVCRTLEVARSNQYKNRNPRAKRYVRQDDEQVLSMILDAIKSRGTYGYKRTTALVNRDRRKMNLQTLNKKRILRLMQMNKLILKRRTNRVDRPHTGTVMTISSNIRWCTDILEVRCWSGEKVFMVFSLDCHDRELMAYLAKDRPLNHRDIIELMDQTVVSRFGEYAEKVPHEIQWLSDQGPQFIAFETKEYARSWGLKPITTPSYSPESNGMAEAFVKLFKRDYVYANELWTAELVIRSIPGWVDDYNQNHPHSALQMMSPSKYRQAKSNLSS